MYFDLNDEQSQIEETARKFLTARYKPDRVRELAESENGFEQSDWEEMAELGWTGLALPEEWGGQGLGTVELVTVFEQMGYTLAPSPLLSTTIAGLALATCGSDEQRDKYLRPLAEGTSRGTVALFDAGSQARIGEFEMEAESGGDGTTLNGEKVLVMDAGSADFMLVATADGKRHVVSTGADGVTITPETSIDLTRRLFSVRFDGVQVPASDTLPGDGPDYYAVFGRACVALSAELAGIAQRCLEMSVAYAGERQQFGRPIGSYQAVSHRCAQMLLETENARSLTYYAAWTADAEPDSLQHAASMAKAYASDAGWRVANAAIQVHGGIGFTWEHDLHFFLKRARADAAAFGDARWHRARVAGDVLAATAEPAAA